MKAINIVKHKLSLFRILLMFCTEIFSRCDFEIIKNLHIPVTTLIVTPWYIKGTHSIWNKVAFGIICNKHVWSFNGWLLEKMFIIKYINYLQRNESNFKCIVCVNVYKFKNDRRGIAFKDLLQRWQCQVCD